MLAVSVLLQLLCSCLVIASIDEPRTLGDVSEVDMDDVSMDAVSLLQPRMPLVRSSRSLLSKRDPVWRIGLQGFSDGDTDQDERLVMNHLAKCGGSFVKHVLFESVPGTRLSVEDEALSVTDRDLRGNTFIIGLIRNPFEYYVSLWAFTSDPTTCCFKDALTPQQQQEMLSREVPVGRTAEDRERFKRWLFAINSWRLGTESSRFYGSYLYNWGADHRLLPTNWHYLRASSREILAHSSEVNDVLANFTIQGPRQGPVDCWIRTESLNAGMVDCLNVFEQQVGEPVVDWAALNRSVTTVYNNSAPHMPCEMFYDNESLALVRSADKHIIRAFGYPDGCE
mmetsp:Transcript_31290/g.89791  ORF Transcript_31290/g.89791 Transcript_31290/m.89791 type:complete len:339 (-) Transcript_31290:226-1242(-)